VLLVGLAVAVYLAAVTTASAAAVAAAVWMYVTEASTAIRRNCD